MNFIARKWNYEKHEYEPYELPDRCYLFGGSLKSRVACAQCGKGKEYGNTFTSKEIHTSVGLGYPVCEKCYRKEVETEKRYEKAGV